MDKKEEGIRKSYDNAGQEWKLAATETLWKLCRRQDFVTSEDVIHELQLKNIKTHNLSALGGIFRRAKNNGWIKSSGITFSQRKTRHSAPIRRWKSLIQNDRRFKW